MDSPGPKKEFLAIGLVVEWRSARRRPESAIRELAPGSMSMPCLSLDLAVCCVKYLFSFSNICDHHDRELEGTRKGYQPGLGTCASEKSSSLSRQNCNLWGTDKPLGLDQFCNSIFSLDLLTRPDDHQHTLKPTQPQLHQKK
jgi:hypothetical protein